MGTKAILTLLGAFLLALIAFFSFDYFSYSHSSKNYNSEIKHYQKINEQLSKRSEHLIQSLHLQDSLYVQQSELLATALHTLESKRERNKQKIDSLMEVQEKLKQDYCKAMAALDRTHLSRCQ